MNNQINQIKELLYRQYPQNFIIQKPIWGAIAFIAILFLFAITYQPLQIHEARSFSFSLTVLLYGLLISICVFIVAVIIKKTSCFSKNKRWTVSKELFSILIILTSIGLSAYSAGFLIEDQGERLNMSTFLDSFIRSVLIGVVPVVIPSLVNIRFAFTPEIFQEYKVNSQSRQKETNEKLIQIKSKAKKEELSFLKNEFIYAESKGNYVIFHLIRQEREFKVTIRNSISDIEQQLDSIPHFMRTHRAFIVNLGKVISKKGNSLGYHLKLQDSSSIIPVSRQNVKKFDELSQQFLLSIHH
ncbi:MAG: LytR/AlgR family response regulator transcription factor [Bacteroidales bacterium]